MLKRAALAVFLVAICRAQAPAQNRDGGRVSGQVTSITGEPVKNAAVHLIAFPHAAGVTVNAALDTYNTTSDASGNFAFEALAAGQYEVRAEHGGYLRSIGMAGRAEITLTAGQQETGISIKLTPEGRIEGTITDEDGDPVSETRLFVLRWTASNGLKRLVEESGNIRSAPDGSFVIGGQTAGFYYVCVELVRGNGTDVPRGRSAHEAYIPTFYPGVAELSSASLVKVEAGGVIRGVNIRMVRAAVHSFRGKAINSLTNTPAAGMSINLVPASLRQFQTRFASTQDDGSFEFDALAPGEYSVGVGYARPPVGSQATRLFAAPIVIGNGDVEDAVLRLIPAVEVVGKVTAEGNGGSPTLANLTVGLHSVSGNGPSARSGKDATFVLPNIDPDRYLPTVTGLSPGMYVKAIRFGNEDVSGKMIDLTSGIGGTLEVVLAPNAADVSGILLDSKGNPLPQMQVSLWKPGQSLDGVFVPLVIFTDYSGTFHFANLPSGEYRVAAWASPAAVFASEFLSQFDSAAAAVKLQEGSHESVEVPLIPQDAIESALGNLR